MVKQDSMLGTEVNIVEDTVFDEEGDELKSLSQSVSTDPACKSHHHRQVIAIPHHYGESNLLLRRIQFLQGMKRN